MTRGPFASRMLDTFTLLLLRAPQYIALELVKLWDAERLLKGHTIRFGSVIGNAKTQMHLRRTAFAQGLVFLCPAAASAPRGPCLGLATGISIHGNRRCARAYEVKRWPKDKVPRGKE